MQNLLANGNYAPYLAQAMTPPFPGLGMTSVYGAPPGIGQEFGTPPFGVGMPGQIGGGQFGGQLGGQFGNQFGPAGPGGLQGAPFLGGYQGLQGGLGQPQVMQQQQLAATLHQLAHHAVQSGMIGQQISANLQHLANYIGWRSHFAPQIAQVLNQLAQQCAGQQGGLHNPLAASGQPFGHGFGASPQFGQAWGQYRPLW
jgi:hypothetical protein